jgi:cobalt/nickel transport system ATP-binding protein
MTVPSCIIRLEDISFAYPGSSEKVLNHLNLEIFKGDRIGMMAPTGSGKTTLLHTIMGLCTPDSGMVTIFDEILFSQKDFEAVRTRIGLLFQDSDDQLFCPTVLEDVAFGPLNLGYSRQEAAQLAENTLKRLGLTGFEERITHRLSGGQKRLVALAAVLAMKPEVLLLDEPTTGLDQEVKETLIRILNELKISCLVISHEFDFITAVTDKIYSMDKGHILTDAEISLHRHEHVHKHGSHPHVH